MTGSLRALPIDPSNYPWLSAALIAWGLLDCFFGYRVFKITIAVLGGLVGALLGHALALALNLDQGGSIVAMVVGGLVGAGLAFALYLAAVFLAGFGFGLILGILLLARLGDMVAVTAGCVLGVVAGFVAIKVQRILIILSTALLGSFRALLGVSYFTDLTDWLYYLRQPGHIPALLEEHAWLFPAILVLAAVGTVAQFEGGGASRKKKDRDK